MLAVAFCVCHVHAQNNVETDTVANVINREVPPPCNCVNQVLPTPRSDDNEEMSNPCGDDNEDVSELADGNAKAIASPRPAPKHGMYRKNDVPAFKSDNYEDVAGMVGHFNSLALANQASSTDDYKNILFPVEGKSKFMQKHHVTQRLEISMIVGKDKNENIEEDASSDFQDNSDGVDNLSKYENKTNFGLNIGYSLVFVPGHIEGDQLRLNKFGFGYSAGLVASFDKQDYYGVTCDFLLKLGVETGNGHQMGIGIDALVGTGKSCGNLYYSGLDDSSGNNEPADESVYEDWAEPYTAWCFKYGAQLWVRSNLLRTSLSNTDIRLFARYVYSVNPNNINELEKYGIDDVWSGESWQFGITFCYSF